MSKVIAPNGLPITCWRANGNELEHPHADHPTYRFPVDVEWTGVFSESDECHTETHALIYTDDFIALTIYECCYAVWSLADGHGQGALWKRREWRLTQEARAKIRAEVK